MTPTKKKKSAAKPPHSHLMRREIYEQPAAIAKTVAKHLKNDIIFPGELDAIESALLTFEKLIIAASGSSRHAGLAPTPWREPRWIRPRASLGRTRSHEGID